MKINGKEYKVVENLGYEHSRGRYAKVVDDNGIERVILKYGKEWKFAECEIRISDGGGFQGQDINIGGSS